MKKIICLLLLFVISGCKKKIESDIKYLSADWDTLEFVDANSEKFLLSSTRGKHRTIYFGFSHCPDMCPMALKNLSTAMQILGPKANSLENIFITLDPDRDTPDQMKKYVEMFQGKHFRALTPDEQTLEKLMSMFLIRKEKRENGKGYTIDHSNFIFLIDGENGQLATYPGSISPQALAKELMELVP